MTLMRWYPFRSIMPLKRQFDRFFEELEDEAPTKQDFWRPAVDIFETKDNLVLRAELPGVDKKDVKINLDNDVLSISGERRFDHEVKEENCHRIECSYGNFFRSFTLPTKVDKDKIEARHNDGVLEVVLPMREEAKPRPIEVKVN